MKKSRLARHFILFFAISISALLVCAPVLYARTFSSIVAFGDSLTDYGNLKKLIPEAQTVYSNGNVWAQYLAADWGASLDNNAIAGAMTQYNVDISGPYGFLGEVDTYTSSSPSFDAGNTLFAVLIGGNDILNFLRTDPNPAADADQLITTSMTNITTGMTALADAGVKYFLVLNLPDIGKTPLFTNSFFGETAESAVVTQLTQGFNAALATTITAFEKAHPNVTVYSFDTFSYVDQIISSGDFTNTTDTYLIVTFTNGEEGFTYDQNGDLAHNDPASAYMFWDSIHPMTATHKLLADEVASYVGGKDNSSSGSTCFISTAASAVSMASGGTCWVLLLVGIGLSFLVFRIRKPS